MCVVVVSVVKFYPKTFLFPAFSKHNLELQTGKSFHIKHEQQKNNNKCPKSISLYRMCLQAQFWCLVDYIGSKVVLIKVNPRLNLIWLRYQDIDWMIMWAVMHHAHSLEQHTSSSIKCFSIKALEKQIVSSKLLIIDLLWYSMNNFNRKNMSIYRISVQMCLEFGLHTYYITT